MLNRLFRLLVAFLCVVGLLGLLSQATVSVGQTTSLAQIAASVRVRVGGGAYTDSVSKVWLADTGASGGQTYQTSSSVAIAGTSDPEIYRGERYGNFNYALALPNGSYTLRLHFAEIYFTQANQRKFNVSAEGTQVLSSYDIVADAGGANKAVIKSFPITISDGQLNLAFTSVVNNAKISAIEVVPVGQVPTLTKASGDNQTGTVGAALSQPLVVQTPNASGSPQAGVTVAFSVTAGNGTLSGASVTTDANGKGSTVLTLGTTAGPNTVSATASGVGSVNFTATAVAAAPAKLALSPTTSNGTVGVVLGYGATIRDQYNNLVPSATNVVTFSATIPGSFSPAQAAASAGVLNTQFTPTAAGIGTLTATATGLTSATANLTVNASGSTNSQTLFTTQQPQLPDATDGIAYELGTKFTTTKVGQITALRYWKSPSETGSHTGRLWSASGTLLASVDFTGETASGWQTQLLVAPLTIDAGTVYVVSVNANNHFATTGNALASAVVSGDLATVADGNNGVFISAPGSFPSSSFQNSNYFRDIVFSASSGSSSALSLVSGNNQTAKVATALPLPLVVQVLNASGNPQAGTTINFSVTSGSATLSSASVSTDGNGRAQTALTFGTKVGPVTVNAVAPGIGSVTFTANATAGTPVALALSPSTAAASFGGGTIYRATVQDQYGNTVTTATNSVSFSVSGLTGSFDVPIATASAGVATSTFTPSSTGTATITAIAQGLTTAQATLNVTLASRINAGAGNYTDGLGNLWASDTGFSGGSAYQNSSVSVAGTSDPVLYQSERYGNSFSYAINLPNGSYTLRLHFAEIYFTSPGQRTLNVSAEGTQILSSYDIVADAGGANKAVIKSFPVTISDGQLNLVFTGVVNNAKVSAIEVLPAGQTSGIVKVSGDNQSAAAGSVLPQPLVVQVLNGSGTPQAGITVNFGVTAGNGTLSKISVATDANGKASTVYTLGNLSGLNSIQASASGLGGVVFTENAVATSAVKVTLTPISSATIINTPFTYRASIQDAQGNTVTTANGTINVQVSGVSGTLNPTTVTATNGVASVTFTPTTAGVATLSAKATGLSTSTAKLVVSQPNGIVLENRKTGTTDWKINSANQAFVGQIEGYADATSVNKGSTINFKVSMGSPGLYSIGIFRLGYYGGTGGRQVTPTVSLSGTTQTPCAVTETSTGLVECNWATSYSLAVGNDWTSGLYLAKLTDQQTNKQTYIWFVVRDDSGSQKILYESSFTTYLAYNSYGGYCIYSFCNAQGKRGFKVSLDRPFIQTLGNGEFNTLLRWEYNMVRWLESQGYDMAYATNLDFETNANLLSNHKVFLTAGHDEYWSLNERNAVETARDAGKNLIFLSANTAYWRTRFENSSLSGQPNRVMVCYKQDFSLDPVAPTNRWRDPANNRPENALLGVMYIGDKDDIYGGFDFKVANSSNAYYANTGVSDGSIFKQLVGFEWDGVVDNGFTPSNLVLLSNSVVQPTTIAPGLPVTTTQISSAVRYTAQSGAKVFASGSIQWAWGLDDEGVIPTRADDRVRQMTANILGDMGVLPLTPAANLVLP